MSKQGELTKPPVPNVSDATTISLRAHQPFFFSFLFPFIIHNGEKIRQLFRTRGDAAPVKKGHENCKESIYCICFIITVPLFFFYTGNEMIILHVWEADRIRVFAWVRSKGG